MSSVIGEFWDDAKAKRPEMTNDPKYGLVGLDGVRRESSTLVVDAFPTDYATVRFKKLKPERFDSKLTEEQRTLMRRFMALQTMGYMHTHDSYLLGQRSERGSQEGLLEAVPIGFVDPLHNEKPHDVIHNTVLKEMEEETGLTKSDLASFAITHFNTSFDYGDFTAVCALSVDERAVGKQRANPSEHAFLQWTNRDALRANMRTRRHTFAPATVALFEKL